MQPSTNHTRSNATYSLARLHDELQAIPATEVRQLNVNVRQAAGTIMTSLPRVRQLQARMAELPHFDVTLLDRLQEYAIALLQADVACQTSANGPQLRTGLLKQARELRKTLLFDAAALAGRYLIDNDIVQHRLHANSAAGVAQNLEVLADALKTAWPNIEGKCAVTPADLDGALELAARLRDPTPRARAEAADAQARDLRNRAFTLADTAYYEIRRAVSFLRWAKGDADKFAPPLRKRRSASRRAS